MQTIKTQIEINAPLEAVWNQLIDFKSYNQWNPFITQISGTLATGAYLAVTIHPPDGKPMTFRPRVISAIANQEFIWRGHLWIKGLFDGTHFFHLENLSNGKTKLIHGEHFSGLFVPIILKMIGDKTLKGFQAMNRELKKILEN